MSTGVIKKVAGPLVIAEGMRDCNMFDVVHVSNMNLIGEVIEMHGDRASIQVYEETSGLGPGEPVVSTGNQLSVELGPGLIESIYDGIQRPLDDIMKVSGNNLSRGISVPALKRDKLWQFSASAKVGDKVTGGDVIGTVQETEIVLHKIMVPAGISGLIKEINSAGEERAQAIRQFQANVMQIGARSLNIIPPSDRDISTLTMAVDQKGFEDIKSMIQEFRKEVQIRVDKCGKPSRVLQMNLALFPVAFNKKSAK